jgi:hypothetical protein
MTFLLFNVNITIEPIKFQTLPPASPFTCATATAAIFSSHLFSSIAFVTRSVSKYALTCVIFPLSLNFTTQQINHIVPHACQSRSGSASALLFSEISVEVTKKKRSAQIPPLPKTQAIRKKGMNADKAHSQFPQTASAFISTAAASLSPSAYNIDNRTSSTAPSAPCRPGTLVWRPGTRSCWRTLCSEASGP